MTSGWVCLAVDLQVDPQNDATLNSDRKFRSVRLDCFLPPPNPRQLLSLRRSVQSQADSGLPTHLIPTSFRRVNHTFLYLYPRDR